MDAPLIALSLPDIPPNLAPHSEEELAHLLKLTQAIKEFPFVTREEQNKILTQLESFECLGQACSLLRWRIKKNIAKSGTELFLDYLWLMRIQYLGLENFNLLVETAKQCVQTMQIPFQLIHTHVGEEILGHNNYREQTLLYQSILDDFKSQEQQVLALEKLTLIYEKNLFLENDPENLYRRLLEIDPHNLKALRYFKKVYIETGHAKQAAQCLEHIISSANNKYEKQRAAHELAQIYLYQLNEAQKARDVLYAYCIDSPLDIHQTLIDALERLNSFDELLRLLKSLLEQAQTPEHKILYLRHMAEVNQRAGRFNEARSLAEQCLELNETDLLSYENLIVSLIELQDLDALLVTLNKLKNIVSPENNLALEALKHKAEKLQKILQDHKEKL